VKDPDEFEMPKPHKPFRTRSSSWFALALLLALTFLPPHAHAQGCTQCRDNTASTTPATQRAYRHAIILMSAAAATFFVATLVLFKRNP
jgi:hypothetical protein